MKIFIHVFMISSFCIYIFQSYDIQRVENYEIISFNLSKYYRIFEFNSENYFKSDRSYVNILQRKCDICRELNLYIYYDKNKIKIQLMVVENYDKAFYFINYGGEILQLNLNLTNPLFYLVFSTQEKRSNILSFQIFNSNSIHTQIFLISILNLILIKYLRKILILFLFHLIHMKKMIIYIMKI